MGTKTKERIARVMPLMEQLASLVRGSTHRANRGLYHGKTVISGNNVSFSKNRTRRKWKPNKQSKRLMSLELNEVIKLNVTTHALRCIDKAGGLDEYILGLRASRLEPGTKEHELKTRIMRAR